MTTGIAWPRSRRRLSPRRTSPSFGRFGAARRSSVSDTTTSPACRGRWVILVNASSPAWCSEDTYSLIRPGGIVEAQETKNTALNIRLSRLSRSRILPHLPTIADSSAASRLHVRSPLAGLSSPPASSPLQSYLWLATILDIGSGLALSPITITRLVPVLCQNMSGTIQWSIVLPAYNEAARILPYLRSITSFMQDRGQPYEVLVVDDGSTDSTAAVVESLASSTPEIQLLRAPVRQGKGAAVRRGMQAAVGRLQLFADADGAT